MHLNLLSCTWLGGQNLAKSLSPERACWHANLRYLLSWQIQKYIITTCWLKVQNCSRERLRGFRTQALLSAFLILHASDGLRAKGGEEGSGLETALFFLPCSYLVLAESSDQCACLQVTQMTVAEKNHFLCRLRFKFFST